MPFSTDKIREFRQTVGITQSAMAEILQVPQCTVARWETGVSGPSATHIGLLCDFGYAHGVRPDFFFPSYNNLKNKPKGFPGANNG